MSFTDLGQFQFKSAPLMKLTLQAEKILKANTDVLIWGASGTGKTTWAKKLAARRSPNNPKIFEGRDFSFEEFFEQVQNPSLDTVIIEEIDQLSFADQSKLLLWLDNPSRKIKALFTSKACLSDLVHRQSFRSDLFFRISVATMRLPEIREFREDISHLAQHFLGVYGILHNKTHLHLSDEAIKRLCEWGWPGNFAELENVIEKAVLLSDHQEIQGSDIEFIEESTYTMSALPIKRLADVERDLILQTLKVTDQNRTRAAEILGISIRTLRNKIQEYREEGIL